MSDHSDTGTEDDDDWQDVDLPLGHSRFELDTDDGDDSDGDGGLSMGGPAIDPFNDDDGQEIGDDGDGE